MPDIVELAKQAVADMDPHEEDIVFSSRARTLIPELVAEIERLRNDLKHSCCGK